MPSWRGTAKGFIPLSSVSTIRRAITTAMQGIPQGAVGVINLLWMLGTKQKGWKTSNFAALSEGVRRLNEPSGRRVAIVSMFIASNPWPTSDKQKWPLSFLLDIVGNFNRERTLPRILVICPIIGKHPASPLRIWQSYHSKGCSELLREWQQRHPSLQLGLWIAPST